MSSDPNEILKSVQAMQKRETSLYEKLEDPKLTPDERDSLVDTMNNLAQARIGLYDTIHKVYTDAQTSANQVDNTLEQQLAALKIIENQMDDAKKRKNTLRAARSHQLRLVEINTYYGKKYQSYTRVMKAIVLTCLPLIIIYTLRGRGILSEKLSAIISGIVMCFGGMVIIKFAIDYSSRDSMNFDQYKWSFDADSAPTEEDNPDGDEDGDGDDVWGPAATSACVGAECCTDNMVYDDVNNVCRPKATVTETMISGHLSKHAFNTPMTQFYSLGQNNAVPVGIESNIKGVAFGSGHV